LFYILNNIIISLFIDKYYPGTGH